MGAMLNQCLALDSRPSGGAARRAPLKLQAAIASNGPIIHGRGVFSQAQIAPPMMETVRPRMILRSLGKGWICGR